MPFPRSAELKRFIAYYKHIRAQDWNTKLNELEQSFKVTTRISEQDDKTTITGICDRLEATMAQADALKEQVAFILELGHEAQAAFARSTNSLFGRILHAMRTHAIAILENAEEKAFSEIKINMKRIQSTFEEAADLAWLGGAPLDQNEKQSKAQLLELAYLGDRRALRECLKLGYTKELGLGQYEGVTYPSASKYGRLDRAHQSSYMGVNPHVPWVYQTQYHQFLHKELCETFFAAEKPEPFQAFLNCAHMSKPLPLLRVSDSWMSSVSSGLSWLIGGDSSARESKAASLPHIKTVDKARPPQVDPNSNLFQASAPTSATSATAQQPTAAAASPVTFHTPRPPGIGTGSTH